MARILDGNKVVIFTGAGISAESGIQTFRDSGGLWNEYSIEDVATLAAWKKDPALVLNFYNERKMNICIAEPNSAHMAIAALEKKYNVVVITQNIDDLHERAGSSNVIHLHGEIMKARSTYDETLIHDIGNKPLYIGSKCQLRSQLRPHVVWFGELIMNDEISKKHISNAARILVVGTSLSVYPAANLLKKASHHAEKIIISLDIAKKPYGYQFICAKASKMVPNIIDKWLYGKFLG